LPLCVRVQTYPSERHGRAGRFALRLNSMTFAAERAGPFAPNYNNFHVAREVPLHISFISAVMGKTSLLRVALSFLKPKPS